MDEHKDEVTDRHQTLGLLRGMCMAMSIVILAGGIVMFNNYERMQEMESVIASAIPERVESALMGKDNAAGKDKPESHVVVEEAEGGRDKGNHVGDAAGQPERRRWPGGRKWTERRR